MPPSPKVKQIPEKKETAQPAVQPLSAVANAGVFAFDDTPLQTSMPRPTHWSIAWSDLMMTMFILFLSLFVYQTANRDLLDRQDPEIVGGDVTQALDSSDFDPIGLPANPVKPGLPLITAGEIDRVELITLQDIEIGNLPAGITGGGDTNLNAPAAQSQDMVKSAVPVDHPTGSANAQSVGNGQTWTMGAEGTAGPLVFSTGDIDEIYRQSSRVIAENRLGRFISSNMHGDGGVRISLAGDFLFEKDSRKLSYPASFWFEKLAAIVRKTPYMITIAVHTENNPDQAGKFAGDLEFSLARAGSLARFLIEQSGMNPDQFEVRGYSARPGAVSDTTRSRRPNDRVELIINNRLPQVFTGQEQPS